MTAEYETFHTIGGDTERVLVRTGGPTVYAPDPRPKAAAFAAAPMETGTEQQLEHLFTQKRGQIAEAFALSPALLKEEGEEPLAKVLPAGGPLLPGHPADKTPVWRCEACGLLSTTERRPSCLQSRTFGCPMVKS